VRSFVPSVGADGRHHLAPKEPEHIEGWGTENLETGDRDASPEDDHKVAT
jgi:hypothetical protein